jgi:nitrogenase-associated protein
MAEIIFYEKPGCINNTKQKRLLALAGHVVIARNLLTESWSGERLQRFFEPLPVHSWFNRTAPQVRDGEIDPDGVDAQQAMMLLINTPLLIRRPLLVIDGEAVVGFDVAQLNQRFSLGLPAADEDLEGCPRKHEQQQGCEVTA